MQPLTEQQTQRVWSRVMNAQAVPAAQMNEQTGSGSAAADSLTPEKLLELIRDERADSALYAHLACRMKGKAQAMLREMARQEACHAKQFGAVYFLKTGKKACPAGRMRRASPASTKRSASAIPRSTPRTRRIKRSPKTPERTAVCC